MIYRKQFILGMIALLATSVTAFGQASDKAAKAEARREAVKAATMAIGLDKDQVKQLRMIRSEQLPKDVKGAARKQLRAEKTAKLMAVLNADQKAKLDEVKMAGASSKAFEGAVLLGLAQRPKQ
ncbi:MAG: hypothetical protein OXD30_14320 [Bryobacterales bacterium]|nr:hypothetical protein [Bryobacterales bacterium]